jgi:hypothetical protein
VRRGNPNSVPAARASSIEQRLQPVLHRSPILRRGFHRHLADFSIPQPCLQVRNLLPCGAELPLLAYRLLTTLPANYYRQHLLMHVDPGDGTRYYFYCFHIDLLVDRCAAEDRSRGFTVTPTGSPSATSTAAIDLLPFSSPLLCGTCWEHSCVCTFWFTEPAAVVFSSMRLDESVLHGILRSTERTHRLRAYTYSIVQGQPALNHGARLRRRVVNRPCGRPIGLFQSLRSQFFGRKLTKLRIGPCPTHEVRLLPVHICLVDVLLKELSEFTLVFGQAEFAANRALVRELDLR